MNMRMTSVKYVLLLSIIITSCGKAIEEQAVPISSPSPSVGIQATLSPTLPPSLTPSSTITPMPSDTPTATKTPLPTPTPLLFDGTHLTPLPKVNPNSQFTRLAQIKVPCAFGNRILFSPTRSEMFFTGTGLLIERLDLLTNNLLPKLTGLTEMAPLNLALSPDHRLLATDDVGWIRVWDLDTGDLIQTLRGSPLGPSAIYFNQAGNHLLATYNDGKLVMWDRSTWEEVSSVRIPGHQWRVMYIPGREALVLDHKYGFVSIVDLEGQVLSTIDLQTRDYDFVSASPDGSQIIVHVGLGLRIFDITTGDEVQFLSLGELRLPTVTPDWRLLITFDTKKRLHIIDLESGETLLTQQMDFFKARWLAVSPDGGLIGLFVIGPDQKTPYIELWGLVEEAETEP